MKRLMSFCYILLLCLLVVGCSCEKKEKEDEVKDEITKTISEKLYTDDTKLVYDNNGIYKLVFYYSNDKITKVEHYYKYADIFAAKAQYEKDKEEYKDYTSIKEINTSGKYVIFTMNESEYEGKTVDDIKQTYSYLKPIYK